MSSARTPARVLFATAALLSLAAVMPAASFAPQQIVDEENEPIDLLFGSLLRTDSTVQVGENQLNRFTMHRLRRPMLPHRGVILLLPSLGNSFEMYTCHESGDIRLSFAACFATLGYDVWGYSPRSTNIAAGACAGGLDCSAALGWSLQTIVDDVGFIRAQIEAAAPGEDPVIGGLSLGAVSALAVVDQHPDDYAGLLAWEGSLVTDDPATQAHNLIFYQQFDAMLSVGMAIEDQSLPFVKLIAQLAQTAPDDPFALPVPGFPPGLTNHQAFVVVMTLPNPLAPSPRPGFTTATGDFTIDQLFFSSDARLFANLSVFNDVTSNGVARDLYGSLAGVITSYSDNLASFTGPTLIIKAGQGFGSIMDELPGKLGSTDVVTLSMEDFGHVDHFGSPYHWLLVELPIANWLRTRVFD